MVVLHHAGFAIPALGGSEGGFIAWIGRIITTFLRRMDLGVPLFFVISGYCIAASVDATRRRGSSSLRFLSRRVWRIYPPYWVAIGWFLLVTLGLKQLGYERLLYGKYPYALELIPPDSLSIPQWFGNLTLTESWRPLIGGGPQRIFTRVAWSLCYEEQFYFVCFAALLLAGRWLYGTLAAITALIVLFRLAAGDVGLLPQIQGTFVDLWHEFAIGLAVYWRLNLPTRLGSRRAVELGLAALIPIGLFVSIANAPTAYSLAASAAFGLALIALRDFDGTICWQPWYRPIRACGRRSYSIYLAHLPVTTVLPLWLYERGFQAEWTRALVVVPVVTAAAVATGFGFFAAVERHFLNPPIVGRTSATDRIGRTPLPGEKPVS